MRTKFFDATVYARVQPRPLVGDETWPNGIVGITFQPTPSLSATDVTQMSRDLDALVLEMGAAAPELPPKFTPNELHVISILLGRKYMPGGTNWIKIRLSAQKKCEEMLRRAVAEIRT